VSGPKITPSLDPEFVPAALWNRAYREAVAARGGRPLTIALERPGGACSVFETKILPPSTGDANLRYVERLVKSLLWMRGGRVVTIDGAPELADRIGAIYAPGGARAFDHALIGRKVYGGDLQFVAGPAPRARETAVRLGRNLEGCRIGFDLGGSDRKGAAVVDGSVVFSEEIPWDPYFQKEPAYHRAGIQETLKRCAVKLPRVDAIGGSAAGVYVDNRVRVASLFRGVPEEDFQRRVVPMFEEMRVEWSVPLVVVNDGEVTALAGSMQIGDGAVLGISMGTSVAGGYVTPAGTITDWLNELAFVPIDYRPGGPVDEWSGDEGCAVQYFSQQGVARLAARAGFAFPDGVGLPERLVEVQKQTEAGHPRARAIFETLGVCFGYTVAHWAEFYEIRHVLLLGRVMSGAGGDLLAAQARRVLSEEFPSLAERIRFHVPDEAFKRHGQAVAAASLPEVRR
jgi:predicted NBD/HSP70 family sugar kinase